MDSPTNPHSSGIAHPSPADSTATRTHPFQGGEESRDFFDVEIEDDEPVPRPAATAAARTAVRSRRPPVVKPTPNIIDPIAAKRNSTATRGRAESVAPAGTFCVLTQLLSECSIIQAAHVAPRRWHKLFPELIRNIEYHLGFPKAKSLNLDTRWNIFFLHAEYHILYDNGGIIVIPTLATLRLVLKFIIMNQKLRAANKPVKFFLEFFKTPAPGWRYEVLPVGVISQKSIFRKTLRRVKHADGSFTWEDTDNYHQHKYPFHTLPYIRSHVNPCFIILSAWNTLTKTTERPAVWTKEQREALLLIHQIVDELLSPASSDFEADLDVERLAGDPEEVEDDHAYRESTPILPLDPVITNNLPTVQTPDGSPAMHSSPLNDHTERRALTRAVPEPTWSPMYSRGGSDNNENAEAGPSHKRVLDVSDGDAPVAGPSKRSRT